MDSNDITGIILAGGKSSRMGVDKGLVDFQGKPLIQYSIETLQPICSSIMISSNSPTYHEMGFPVQKDIIPGSGPMGGIYSALLNSSSNHNLILPCDTPFVTPDLMKILIDESKGYQIVIPVPKPGFPEPLIGYYHKQNAATMLSFIKNRRLKIIDYIETTYYKSIPVYKKPWLCNPVQFKNINLPEDLKVLGKRK